jgi:hypothetical protein
MPIILQVLSVILVALAMALAHALELPGKKRLDRTTYYAIQPIYYPGFTIGGGIGEVGGTIATAILLLLTAPGHADFWLTLMALFGLIAMQVVYWFVMHPVNQFWVAGVNLDRFSSVFFIRSTSLARSEPNSYAEVDRIAGSLGVLARCASGMCAGEFYRTSNLSLALSNVTEIIQRLK